MLWLMIDLGIHSKGTSTIIYCNNNVLSLFTCHLLDMLVSDWLVEALHLAHMISHLGYIYPVDKVQLGQPIKDDGTLYRLQVTIHNITLE